MDLAQRTVKACEGKSYSQGGLNIPDIQEILRSRGVSAVGNRQQLLDILCDRVPAAAAARLPPPPVAAAAAAAAARPVARQRPSKQEEYTGYMKFASINRESVKSANPGMSFTDIGKTLGRMWGELSDAEKRRYNEMPPPRHLVQLGERMQQRRQSVERTIRATKKTQSLAPYMNFATMHRESVKSANPDMTFTEIGRELGRLWGELSDAEKRRYA